MNNGLYGITQDTSEHERSFDPDPENTPLFRAIFWSLIASVLLLTITRVIV